ncbi:hypothetical protein [Rhizobium sp. N324]|uniref:hypothetical protein n=1 Tax=Rhizobium sp. N324 TaxID=1703969 RepID=UPI0007EB05E3|nr:hypothetical protein [Rhizobium sp. N324]ANM12098.1 hypothetical protein AMK05_CH03749 [Rhizobium sp. N324]
MLKTDVTAGTARITCDSCRTAMESVMDADPRAARDKAVPRRQDRPLADRAPRRRLAALLPVLPPITNRGSLI